MRLEAFGVLVGSWTTEATHPDHDGVVREHLDSRGVRRTYGASIVDGVLRWWRGHPGPGEWRGDLEVTFRRER